jgi:hypothetical protein
MKTISFTALMIVATTVVFGQDKTKSSADETAIRETVLNYVEGFYTADTKRMSQALHPELAKRIIQQDTVAGTSMLGNMGATALVFATGHQKPRTEKQDEPFRADIRIYDVFKNVATVKVVTNKFRFIDYIHLGKFNGQWKIVNVLWEFQ